MSTGTTLQTLPAPIAGAASRSVTTAGTVAGPFFSCTSSPASRGPSPARPRSPHSPLVASSLGHGVAALFIDITFYSIAPSMRTGREVLISSMRWLAEVTRCWVLGGWRSRSEASRRLLPLEVALAARLPTVHARQQASLRIVLFVLCPRACAQVLLRCIVGAPSEPLPLRRGGAGQTVSSSTGDVGRLGLLPCVAPR